MIVAALLLAGFTVGFCSASIWLICERDARDERRERHQAWIEALTGGEGDDA